MYTRCKICGITRLEDALRAVELGADALGFIFYAASPRYVSVERVREIVAALPPFVTTVGVFVDASAETIKQVLSQVSLDRLQFHGNESPEQCAAFGKPYIKTLRVQAGVDIKAFVQRYSPAHAILLDAYHPQTMGGAGVVFDWQLIPQGLAKPIILAGGLNAANVATAIRVIRPYAVDVTSGVEAAPGVKDPAKLKAFIHEVRSVESKEH